MEEHREDQHKEEENNNEEKVNVDDILSEHIQNNQDNSNLSKHERKLLKRHNKEEERQKIESQNKQDRKSNLLKYSAISIIIVVVVVFGYRSFSGGSDSGSNPITGSTTLDIEVNEKVKGDPNAPVTIVEYSDFECPFCGRFVQQTFPSIEQQYISTGKVKFIYKHFPLRNIHFSAQTAAEAAECANEQEKFWEYHDLLFQNSPRFRENNLIDYATQVGLNIDQFQECLKSGKYKGVIEKDLRDGSAAGIRGTPGFIVNGQLISGAQPFSVFQQLIDSNF
ncbi:MAG: DsbA family protein [Candidatus Nanoarchaeia archaeon]|jgi:protein-disulfide isomerase|nr:DsbA family protein [Candidatus Nanoarchaeia archaeon]|tara:strand:- start:16107 stop:16946 length:840 start_codon:yes stop_codon:yes gene_type:complete